MGMKGKRSQDKWISTLIIHVFRAGRLTWHEGYIPPSEVWLKIGGDKGGGTFKMNFHMALDRFKDQVEHLHGMKWR